MRAKILVAFLLLLVTSAWASRWAVDSFDNSSEPGEADNYVAAEFSGGLKPVKPEQVTQQSGRLYVRQKFEDPFGDEEATYQIFQGRATEAAKNLGKISLDGIPYQTLLKMKLFYSRNASGDDDLENVYYDGKDIFVEGDDPVYINLNGKMEELKPVIAREYKISITSQPTGATVTVGGNSRGETPVTFSVPSNKTISVSVSKTGFYTTIKPITPSDKQTTQEGFLLTEKVPLVNPAVAFRARLQTAVAAKDVNTIKNIRDEVQIALRNYNADSKKNIDAIMAKFPANPPKAPSETANDFSARQNLWTNTQAKERDTLNKEAAVYFNELKEFSNDANSAAADLDFTLKYEYIPTDAITFTNMGVRDFSINVEHENSRVKFKYEKARLGYGSIPRSEISENEENVHGVLKIWDTPNENDKYASIYDIAFFYKETPLQMLTKGTFTLSDATATSRATEKDLNARIAKYAGKAAWDKKDQAATLEALRKGEIPDVAAKAPVSEEAYYDEDEDDDEFDDGMEEQEERDYSRYGAMSSATDIFGNTDEILFWTGVAFAAAAVGTGIVGFLENNKYMDASDALSITNQRIDEVKAAIVKACRAPQDQAATPISTEDCIRNATMVAETEGYATDDGRRLDPLDQLYKARGINEKTKKSFNQSRIIWFSAAGVSAAISITLFAW